MKTIKEKIEREIEKFMSYLDASDHFKAGYETGFKVGALWMKRELKRKNNPQERGEK